MLCRGLHTQIQQAQGKQVVGGTILLPDPDLYCAVANAGFDYTWIEMQHSPLTYQDVARMIMACKGAPAIPFIWDNLGTMLAVARGTLPNEQAKSYVDRLRTNWAKAGEAVQTG